MKVGERGEWNGNAEHIIVIKKNYTSETLATQLEWKFKTSAAVSESITDHAGLLGTFMKK